MKRAGRITVVTIGLVAAGIVFGALAGGIAFATVGVLAGERITIDAFWIGAVFGAPLGALTAPMLSWLLLRHVPLGRMFLVCSVGTAIGGVVGWFAAAAGGNIILNPLAGAFIGCVIAAIALWHRARLRLGEPA
jgi:hypothetical protein